jgi:hypothetical protein
LSAKALQALIQELIAALASEIEGNTKSGITGVDASKIAKGREICRSGALHCKGLLKLLTVIERQAAP